VVLPEARVDILSLASGFFTTSTPNKLLHLTANSSAIFERLCPAFKQVVFQGLVLRSVGGR